MMENVKNAPVKDFNSLNIPPLEEMMESMELGDCGAKLASQGRFDEAIEFFDKALSIIPHSWTVLKMKGFALLSSHRFSKALKVAEELTSVHPIVGKDG
jgi:tetratricopeptide (TPR) repeat protein